jgi:hypothetical protein
MDTAYDVNEWAAGTTRGRHVFNHNFRMVGKELKGWELVKAVPLQERQGEEMVYLWQSKADPQREMVRVTVAERDGWRQAQQRLREALAQSMRPDIPRGAGKLALGDVSFVGRDPQSDVPAAISFTRGNIFVSVTSVGERNVDVSDVAARLDRLLSEPPSRADLDKRRARERLKAATVGAGEAHVVLEKLSTATPRREWLKIIAPDGELTLQGEALSYSSPDGGKKQIATFVMRTA